jgi:hypothetical protein
MGDGFPSEVGGVGDGACGVPNTNCGVVFVEEDALSGGDDGSSSGRDRCEARCEEAWVVSGLPKGSTEDVSLGLGLETGLGISCGPSSISYSVSISRSFCFQSERPEEVELEAEFFRISSLSSSSDEALPLPFSSESGMTSSVEATVVYEREGGESDRLRVL